MPMPETWNEDIFMSQEDREYFESLILNENSDDMPLEDDYVLPAIPDFVAY